MCMCVCVCVIAFDHGQVYMAHYFKCSASMMLHVCGSSTMDDRSAVIQFASRQASRTARDVGLQVELLVHDCSQRSNGKCGCQLYGVVLHTCRVCEPELSEFLRSAKRKFLEARRGSHNDYALPELIPRPTTTFQVPLRSGYIDLTQNTIHSGRIDLTQGSHAYTCMVSMHSGHPRIIYT